MSIRPKVTVISSKMLKGRHACTLWDVRGEDPDEELASKNWRDRNRGGPVRNQSDHDNCWIYASTDVYSSYRFINGEDDHFRVLSAKYLTFYVSEDERQITTLSENRRMDHMCHGFPVIKGLEFIQDNGVPEEERPSDATDGYMSCISSPPKRVQPVFKFGKDVKFCESSKIEALYAMLLHQPVAANMILYHPEYFRRYPYRPTSEESWYDGLHSVLVLQVVKVQGKWVALVKLSHGEGAGAGGYMYISLTKMILDVEYITDDEAMGLILDDEEKPVARPSLLLRDFTGVDYGANQN
ncbi:unnamed protein product [Eruca vesicaria subsp. sativa]|uniref:Peptidase C1A papain C-terminal domain-containing protein n=1 Tax=Eruca vesicaria subsp. sativa TaxID=29727 RepID=A0ABC8M2T7_ERUVS|nr:unnamed protein product [Eruca vesicaria subsp. sativa]